MNGLFPDDGVAEGTEASSASVSSQQDLFETASPQAASGAAVPAVDPLANDPAAASMGGGVSYLGRSEISNTGLYSARYGAKYCERNRKSLQVTWKRSEPLSFDLSDEEIKACTLGSLLSSARKKCELRLEDVVALTKIRQDFVRALEEDDADSLPPSVFASAYLRTLADLYNVDADGKALLKAKFSFLASHEQNKGLSQSAADRIEQTASINADELKKMKRTFIFSITLMAALCIIIGCAAASCGRSSASQDEALHGEAEENSLIMEKPDTDVLTAPEIPELSVLKISPTPAVAE